jgi:hypothetical protein
MLAVDELVTRDLYVVGRSDKDGSEKQKETDAILQQSFEVLPLCIDTLNRVHETNLLDDCAIHTLPTPRRVAHIRASARTTEAISIRLISKRLT